MYMGGRGSESGPDSPLQVSLEGANHVEILCTHVDEHQAYSLPKELD